MTRRGCSSSLMAHSTWALRTMSENGSPLQLTTLVAKSEIGMPLGNISSSSRGVADWVTSCQSLRFSSPGEARTGSTSSLRSSSGVAAPQSSSVKSMLVTDPATRSLDWRGVGDPPSTLAEATAARRFSRARCLLPRLRRRNASRRSCRSCPSRGEWRLPSASEEEVVRTEEMGCSSSFYIRRVTASRLRAQPRSCEPRALANTNNLAVNTKTDVELTQVSPKGRYEHQYGECNKLAGLTTWN